MKRIYDRHHIIPKSRGGKNKLENICITEKTPHNKYHSLFENRTPYEIINYLVNDFWNGEWDYVKEAIRKYDKF